MPFPLAHPAAVLPLRRLCPRWFNFPALVIGSICPDFGYIFGSWHVARFSHRFFAGDFGFCLPVGLLLWLLFYQLRNWLPKNLPIRQQDNFKIHDQRPAGSFWGIAASLLIGIWTHLLLDSLTHENGSLVRYFPTLQAMVSIGNVHLQICELLYSLITFAGVAWLALVYLNWRERTTAPCTWVVPGFKWGAALILAIFALLLSLFNHDTISAPSLANVIVLTLLLTILFFAISNWALCQDCKALPSKQPVKKTSQNINNL